MKPGAGSAAELSALELQERFSAAIKHHQAGRLAEAEQLYRAINSGGRALPEVHNNLGILLDQRGDRSGAAAEYRKAIAINPADPGALTNLGNALRSLGNAAEAEVSYRRALAIKPDHAEANNNLGMMLSERGQHADALACYRKALAANPRFVDAINNSAIATRRTGNANEAIKLWRQAIALKPNYVEAQVHLADTLADLGAVEEARQHVLIADALDIPPRSNVLFALGTALARCGIRKSAITRLRQCLATDPLDRHGARLALAALDEEPVPERASDAFIDRLYAIWPDRWDNEAGPYPYRGAALVADKVIGDRLDVLDAGCGTGLVGALVKNRASRLVGIDLSASMLELAKRKNIYDELHKGDLLSFMRARPQSFDVVTCAATFIHFGDLGPAFAAARSTLRTGGALVFTVFPNAQDANVSVAALDGLGQGGCFVHGRSHIVDKATVNGFRVETIEEAIHEYKNGSPIMSLVVVLSKI
jgi:predicted TPR repeat methyltransferase